MDLIFFFTLEPGMIFAFCLVMMISQLMVYLWWIIGTWNINTITAEPHWRNTTCETNGCLVVSLSSVLTSPVLNRIGFGWWHFCVWLDGLPRIASLMPSQNGSPSTAPAEREGRPQGYRRSNQHQQTEESKTITLSEVKVSSSICCSCCKTVTQSWFTCTDLRHTHTHTKWRAVYIFGLLLHENFSNFYSFTESQISGCSVLTKPVQEPVLPAVDQSDSTVCHVSLFMFSPGQKSNAVG